MAQRSKDTQRSKNTQPGKGRRFIFWAALSGVISGAVFLATAELFALIFARSASPILAVGGFVIDIVPQPFKEFAIATFGEYDKIALLVGLGLAVVIASAIAGILQLLRPPLGVIALVVAGALSTAAIVTRAGVTPLAFLPPVLGTIAGSILIVLLIRRLKTWKAAAVPVAMTDRKGEGLAVTDRETVGQDVEQPPKAMGRRQFFVLAGIASASAVVVGIASRAVSMTVASVATIRDALKLPAPKSTVTVPKGAELDIPGLSTLFTPNKDFYRVDTALTVPTIDPSTWRLVIDGMVDQRVEMSFQDILDMGLDEYAITLTCVSNEVGGDLVGNAKWLGVPLRDVLKKAGVKSGADMVLSKSVDGYTASTPLSSLTDDNIDAILAVGMNGEPLPLEHGFPVRMVVPGLYGYVSATKWLTELKVTTFDKDEAYWTPRGYSAEAPIKFASRVDTPKVGQAVDAGRIPIAGVAWAQTVGIERVEVRIDEGEWMPATLSAPINENTWVQWFMEWDATPGTHYVAVRAINKNGDMQIEERAPIAPNGSSGWQRSLIRVA
ncbi:DMSO/TMAO reductase YedYZ molybdopterin-dependent catalytic subunit [Microbacterium foliorum]|uniref:DMSO/TMAO reductase YedYZ molybdopterin-dependent catalytic subunit n=1 Tax=Microbacterium foliorum TaxID=104336 RepID=A0ABU1HUS7_9MICO|nr:molybdopterin-dependent oxidoreductase [Microbacterium foliorum]MDR6143803.1 DMSO/TMAO reductase YedYZ molybdopterin-dependent catalytic subunit [Microbacterium foliorum]